MPVPIRPLPDNKSNFGGIDFSILFQQPQSNKKTVTASNKDASLLYELWFTGEKVDNDSIKINADVNISSRDIIRLKTMGFLTGGTDQVKFTKKGKRIITTMALSEESCFHKKRQQKPYTEILASMNKKGKKGFRTASYFAADNSNRLRLD
jgi:hypothetical protein